MSNKGHKSVRKAQGNSVTDWYVDSTLKPRNVEDALMKLAPIWNLVGKELKVSDSILLEIALDDTDDVHHRLFAVILQWMRSNESCKWETIRRIEGRLNQHSHTEILQSKTTVRTKKENGSQMLLEAKQDALNHKVIHADLKDIEEVLKEHCPRKWHKIGLLLVIPKCTLDEIDANCNDFQVKRIEMLSTWITIDKTNTWRELVTVLEKLEESRAACAIEEVYVDTSIPPEVERPSYSNSKFDNRIEEQWQKKEPIMKKLRGLLQVRRSVTDEELINNMGEYIRKAELSETDLLKLVGDIERVQVYITESSTLLKKWATVLKDDLQTTRITKRKVYSRQQELKRIRKRLRRNKEVHHEQSHFFDKKTFFNWLILYNMHQEKWITDERLDLVNTELEKSGQDLERASADCEIITTKLSNCQRELETCVEEMLRFKNAISSSRTIIVKLLRSIPKAVASAGAGAVVGAGIGVFGGPVAIVLCGVACALFGFNEATKVPQEKKLERMVKSCVTDMDEINHVIVDIRNLLNETKHPSNTP